MGNGRTRMHRVRVWPRKGDRMNPLERAARLLDEYASHAADEGHSGTISVPISLLQALRRALKEMAK